MTLGPRGRNVVIDKKWGAPTITNDGVTVAREIELEDPYENLGAQLAKEVATKTNDIAGDGTTTATVLAQAMVHVGLRSVAAGANPMGLKRGIDAAPPRSRTRCAMSPARSRPRRTSPRRHDLRQDPEIGELIAEAFDKVGKDGVITVEESPTMGLELEFTEGLQFDKGYISQYFITDQERLEAVLDDAYVLVTRARSPRWRVPAAAGEDRADQAAAARGRRGRRGRGPVDAGRQQDPRPAQRRRGEGARLRRPPQGDAADIAALTGGQVISEDLGLKLDHVGLDELGTARRIVVTKDNTTIIDGAGDESAVEDRISQIRTEIENTDSDWDREKLQERLAKLSGGVCVLRVGAATEVELKEKKHRIEDAISATRAAIEEGIVAGGGSALVHIAAVLDDLGLTGDEATGVRIVRKAAVGAVPLDRPERGRRGLRRRGEVAARRRARLQRRHRRVRRPGRAGRHRPGQGHPLRRAERRVHRRHAADDRDAGRREAGRGGAARGRSRPRARSRALDLGSFVTGARNPWPRGPSSSRRERRLAACAGRISRYHTVTSCDGPSSMTPAEGP